MMEKMANTWRSKLWRGQPMRGRARGIQRQDGAALVETALSMAVYLAVLFGMITFCYVLYAYNFVSNAARLATRYAVVRGANSCVIAPSFPDCNLSTSGPLQTYVQNLGYPGINSSNVTVTATWQCPAISTTTGLQTGWASCGTGTTLNSQGHAVQVQVTYAFPLSIPFWSNGSLTVGSNSQMMINE